MFEKDLYMFYFCAESEDMVRLICSVCLRNMDVVTYPEMFAMHEAGYNCRCIDCDVPGADLLDVNGGDYRQSYTLFEPALEALQ